MLVFLPKPLKKLTGTDRQAGRKAGRQTDRRTGAQDYVVSQADALTKNHILILLKESKIFL